MIIVRHFTCNNIGLCKTPKLCAFFGKCLKTKQVFYNSDYKNMFNKNIYYNNNFTNMYCNNVYCNSMYCNKKICLYLCNNIK
jgi:hypothetical protein